MSAGPIPFPYFQGILMKVWHGRIIPVSKKSFLKLKFDSYTGNSHATIFLTHDSQRLFLKDSFYQQESHEPPRSLLHMQIYHCTNPSTRVINQGFLLRCQQKVPCTTRAAPLTWRSIIVVISKWLITMVIVVVP